MEKIQNQNHTKETLYYALSRMFERASFYGLRALVVLYMTGEILKMDRVDALNLYGWFVALLVFSQVIGAHIGDLAIGNRKSIIIGGILQAIGTFCICTASITGLYTGLFLIVLGSGLYTPNLISNFGKLYLNKTKLLDSGFTILYFAMNLGSFLGILLIGYLGNEYGFNMGFILSGILMLISVVLVILSKEKKFEKVEASKIAISKRILNILFVLILVGLFWGFYEMSNIRNADLRLQLKALSPLNIPDYFWQANYTIFIFPIGLITIFLWNYFYTSQCFKIMLGFISGAIAFGILFLIPGMPTDQYAMIFLVSLLLLTIAEVQIAPVIHSILTKYSNPKYLAILISLIFLPMKLISFSFGLFTENLSDNPVLEMKVGVIGLTVIGLVLIACLWWNKKRATTKG